MASVVFLAANIIALFHAGGVAPTATAFHAPASVVTYSRRFSSRQIHPHPHPQNIFHSAVSRSTLLFELRSSTTTSSSSDNNTDKNNNIEEEWDVVVVGSGIGGLSAASMCAAYGLKTICVEAHEHAGGVAHSFERKPSIKNNLRNFCFDSGPSLLSGMSSTGTNPLRQVLDAIGTADSIDWITYDGWMVYDTAFPPEDHRSTFRLTTGNDGTWEKEIERKAGKTSSTEFTKFRNRMMSPNGISESSALIPPLALRGDLGVLWTMASYFVKFLSIGLKGTLLTGAFTKCMNMYELNDDFNRRWFDYLAFALSGLDAAHTQAAPVAYTMIDLHKEGAVLDYPRGGMGSLVQALVKGLEMKRGPDDIPGELRLKSCVERFLLEEDNGNAKCSGVQLENGTVLHARKAVICSAPLWNMAKLLENSMDTNSLLDEKSLAVSSAVKEVRKQADAMEMTGSFMHLHLGIPSDGLPDDLECHHSVLNLSSMDVTAEQNLVIVSIPTVFDPTLAPEGYHVIHAYTAASESFVDWEDKLTKRYDDGKTEQNDYKRSEEYKELKERKAEALWLALERIIPDIRERSRRKGSIVEIGTPLTHRRFNRRYRGTYGPAPANGKDIWELPGPKTLIKGLLACGDTTFPGIGLPGVAASGTIAANTIVDPSVQLRLMGEMKRMGALQ